MSDSQPPADFEEHFAREIIHKDYTFLGENFMVSPKTLSLPASPPFAPIDLLNTGDPDSTGDNAPQAGLLSLLPPELLQPILTTLDLASLSNLAQTCRRAAYIIRTLPALATLRRHAPHVLAYYHRSWRTAHSPVVRELHAMLYATRCVRCPRFGAYIFLPLAARVCWACASTAPEVRMLKREEAQRIFDLGDGIKMVNRYCALRGKYGEGEDVVEIQDGGCEMVIGVEAFIAMYRLHGGERFYSRYEELRKEAKEKGDERTKQVLDFFYSGWEEEETDILMEWDWEEDGPMVDLDGGQPKVWKRAKELGMAEDRMQLVMFAPFPALKEKMEAQEMLWCYACEWKRKQKPESAVYKQLARRAWLREEFFKWHLKTCDVVEDIRKRMLEGTWKGREREEAEIEEARRVIGDSESGTIGFP